MKFDWKNKLTKIIPLALLVGIVLVLLPAHFAHAIPAPASTGSCDITDFSLSACIGDTLYAVIHFVSLIFGVFIALILWVIELVLQFNMNVVNTTFVQTGFSVTLGLANLGFVLGIIIVALATILRRETYGIKSILWKLIIMAILVNFALVIAAPIIGFGNNLTMFFINGMPGGSAVANQNSVTSPLKGFDNLSSGIAGAFQPQRLITPENGPTTPSGSATGNFSAFNTAIQQGAGALGTVIGGVVGLVMSIVALIAMCIVLIVLFVMLLIRYVYLEVLLVIAPLAWMAWIFPGTSKHFSKWWDRFIKQVFFPAIAMFFIYLVVQIGGDISPGQNVSVVPVATSWIGGFLSALGFGILGNTIGSFINSALIIGLMMAGLTMASSLSTEGSKLAATAVGKVRDGVTGLAIKRGKKALRATGRGLGVDKAIQNARAGQLGKDMRGKKFLGIPGIGTAAGYLAGKLPKGAVAAAARAAAPYMANEDLVEEAKKNVPKDSAMVEKDLASGTLKNEEIFAWLAQRLKDNLLKPDDMVGKQTVDAFFKTHGDDIKAYGQGKLKYDYGILTGKTDNIRAAEDEVSKAKAAGNINADDALVKVQKDIKDQFGRMVYAVDDQVKASVLLAASYREMAQSWTKEIAGKTDINSMPEEQLKNMIGAFALYSPGLIAPLLKKAKSPALIKIEVNYKEAIRDKGGKIPGELAAEKAAILDSKTLTPVQKKDSADQIDALARNIAEKIGLPAADKRNPYTVVDHALGMNVAFFGGSEFEDRREGGAPKSQTTKP
jgi:hypothetical protein